MVVNHWEFSFLMHFGFIVSKRGSADISILTNIFRKSLDAFVQHSTRLSFASTRGSLCTLKLGTLYLLYHQNSFLSTFNKNYTIEIWRKSLISIKSAQELSCHKVIISKLQRYLAFLLLLNQGCTQKNSNT